MKYSSSDGRCTSLATPTFFNFNLDWHVNCQDCNILSSSRFLVEYLALPQSGSPSCLSEGTFIEETGLDAGYTLICVEEVGVWGLVWGEGLYR